MPEKAVLSTVYTPQILCSTVGILDLVCTKCCTKRYYSVRTLPRQTPVRYVRRTHSSGSRGGGGVLPDTGERAPNEGDLPRVQEPHSGGAGGRQKVYMLLHTDTFLPTCYKQFSVKLSLPRNVSQWGAGYRFARLCLSVSVLLYTTAHIFSVRE